MKIEGYLLRVELQLQLARGVLCGMSSGRARVLGAQWIRRDNQPAFRSCKSNRTSDYLRKYESEVHASSDHAFVVWGRFFDVAPEAKAVIASGWIQTISAGKVSAKEDVREGYRAVMTAASMGCIALAEWNYKTLIPQRSLRRGRLSCMNRVKRSPGRSRPESYKFVGLSRTALFCLQDYILVLPVVLPDQDRTTLYLDFGFVMMHTRFPLMKRASILGFMVNLDEERIEVLPQGVREYLVRNKIIRPRGVSCDRVLSMHDTRPLLNESNSPIRRIMFAKKATSKSTCCARRRGVKRARRSEFETP